MKNKILFVFSLLFLVVLASCGKSSINQKEAYKKIQLLCDGYSVDNLSYTTVLTNEEMHITLTNKGTLSHSGEEYTYSYSYQYLNEIGSASSEFITTKEGVLHGTKDSVLEEGFSLSEDIKVVSLDIANSFKNYSIREEADSLVMKGYLKRNTIIKNTKNLDDDIRFNYELTTDKDITEIQKLVITYVTVRFDSVVVTITF